MKKLLFIIILFILYSCQNSINPSISTASIGDKLIKPDEILLTDITDSIHIIPLETTDNILLRGLSDIEMTDRGFLIADYTLLWFDFDGNFKGEIAKRGNGPGEIAYVGSFFEKDNTIYIATGGQINTYTYEGEHIDSFQFPYFPVTITMTGDEEFVGFPPGIGNSSSQRMIFSDKEKIRKILRKPYSTEGPFNNTIPKEGVFKISDNTYYMKEILNDTIYQIDITNDTIQPFLAFDFGKYKTNATLRYTTSKEEFPAKIPFTNFVGINERFVILHVMTPVLEIRDFKYSTCIYDRRGNHSMCVLIKYTTEQKKELQKKLGNRYNTQQHAYFTPISMSADGNYLIGTINPEDDENPVLVITKLKK